MLDLTVLSELSNRELGNLLAAAEAEIKRRVTGADLITSHVNRWLDQLERQRIKNGRQRSKSEVIH